MGMGTLYGIGVGPGDSGLLTVKGREILGRSQVICVPKSKTERESVALSVVKPYLAEDAVVEELLFPMSRDEAVLEAHWQEAAQAAAKLLEQYDSVAFLTIGDPLLYSTFGYLLKFLQQVAPQAPVEVVPGISSFNAAASLLRIPLVEQNERLAVVPLPVAEKEFLGLSQYVDTVVFLKVSAGFDELLDLLEASEFADEVYLVSRCGTGDEFWTNDPFSLRGQKIDYLSLLIAKRRKG
ncbi:precorrin-2 C(20)-methyltransferase [Dethiobacter alkaliphilus]|uniref:precorrin-2 C(20)-methyltransferase n=1 Tax=Dethiobacter alkaliphilus TaxID=427926 RepID=UPI0022262365|nr:precorrin-2 C(20)-methyltransferase [Dethiobacter alkaliphilus]MCW3491478.1 precorrin-2 C(20)-methyltransferase [Dethiobacter alkaliphilus]